AMAEETEGKRLSVDTLTPGVDAVLDDPQKGFYLIVDVDGCAAGGLLITTEWSDWRNAYFWWIQSVYVKPEYRKRGVYTALHRYVEEAAECECNVCGIRLYVDRENRRAKATYERLGMTPARYDFYEWLLPDKRSN
ncbi:MAG: GNAT family N-acetyltransferase, partial [Candidatus Krumholzibacteria bacterium]|nr:GNAT family N-acetyltransferase [Candidatus Krumholzibacteria bacterium]